MSEPTKQIITIAGRPGSGKSTTAKGVASMLGYDHFSSGDLFRALGKERGNELLQANLAAESESDIDHLVDQRLRDIGKEGNNLVIDSRMAWHWIPGSFKVFLDLDLEIAAKRILGDMTPERIKAENIPKGSKEYIEVLHERLDSESRRYKKLYDCNPYDLINYDLVIDTSKHGLNQVIQLIIDAYQKEHLSKAR